MNTDKQLLEAAARAAGIYLEWDGDPDHWQPMYYDGKTYHGWNPLTDDGAALRLAAKLHIDLEWQATCPFPEEKVEAYQRDSDGNSYSCVSESEADYRRAIVRAAVLCDPHQKGDGNE